MTVHVKYFHRGKWHYLTGEASVVLKQCLHPDDREDCLFALLEQGRWEPSWMKGKLEITEGLST